MSVKIRFDTQREPVNHDSSAYKRKPNSQIQRDRLRSNAWRAKQKGLHPGESSRLLAHARDNESHVGMTTRSRSVISEPEILRSDDPCGVSPMCDLELISCPVSIKSRGKSIYVKR